MGEKKHENYFWGVDDLDSLNEGNENHFDLKNSVTLETSFRGVVTVEGIEIYFETQGKDEFLKLINSPHSNRYSRTEDLCCLRTNEKCCSKKRNEDRKKGNFFDFYRNQQNTNKLKMLIVVTMYNEPFPQLASTLYGIYKNIGEFKKININSDEIAVVVIIDGIFQMNEGVKHLIDRINVNNTLGDLTRIRKARLLTFDFQNVFLLYEIMGIIEGEIYRKELDEFYKNALEFLREGFRDFIVKRKCKGQSVKEKKKYGWDYILCINEILYWLRRLLCNKEDEIEKYKNGNSQPKPSGVKNIEFYDEEKKEEQNNTDKQKKRLYDPDRDENQKKLLKKLRNCESWDNMIMSINKLKKAYHENIENIHDRDPEKNKENLKKFKEWQEGFKDRLDKSGMLIEDEYLPSHKDMGNFFFNLIEMSCKLKTKFLDFCNKFDFFKFHEFWDKSTFVKGFFPAPSYDKDNFKDYILYANNVTTFDPSKLKSAFEYENYLNTLVNFEGCKIGNSILTSIVYELKINEEYLCHVLGQEKANPSNENLNIFLTMKIKNKKKLNSHMWFFKGFCNELKPKYCCLIDCGTVPDQNGLVNFFLEFERNKNIGGLCGAMGARIDKYDPGFSGKKPSRLNFVARAQVFEYAIGHVLDKSFESLFGFIHVLPGAWSAYRWEALSENYILDKKYLTSTQENYEAKSINEINMVLAEDRLLCLALFTKARHKYLLRYVPNAFAQADAVPGLFELYNQRRRWINGSWYALDHVLHFKNDVDNSKHSGGRKLLFFISLAFSKFNMYVIYVSLSLNLMTVKLALDINFSQDVSLLKFPKATFAGFIYTLYLCIILGIFFICIQTKPRDIGFGQNTIRFSKNWLGTFTLLLGMLSLVTYGLMGSVIYQGGSQFSLHNYVWFCLAANFSCYLILMLLNPYFFFNIASPLNWASYIFFLPTYMISFMLFSFCNLDDYTWGTKGNFQEDNKKDFQKGLKDYKVDYVAMWIIINSVLLYILNILNSVEKQRNGFIIGITFFFTFNIGFKTFFALLHIIPFRFNQLRYYISRKIKRGSEYRRIESYGRANNQVSV